jgi:hypothetical protein
MTVFAISVIFLRSYGPPSFGNSKESKQPRIQIIGSDNEWELNRKFK